jgi:hypothetical protein
MSRITAVRSMTFTLMTSSRARRWLGASSPSTITVSAPTAATTSRSSWALPLPKYVLGSGVARFCSRPSSTHGAGGLGESEELAHRVLGLLDRALGVDADEHDLFEAQLPVLDLGDIIEFGREPGDAAQGLSVVTVVLVTVGVIALRAEGAVGLQGLGAAAREDRRARRTLRRARQHTLDDIIVTTLF